MKMTVMLITTVYYMTWNMAKSGRPDRQQQHVVVVWCPLAVTSHTHIHTHTLSR